MVGGTAPTGEDLTRWHSSVIQEELGRAGAILYAWEHSGSTFDPRLHKDRIARLRAELDRRHSASSVSLLALLWGAALHYQACAT